MPANTVQPRRTTAAPGRLAPPRPAPPFAPPFASSQAASSNALRLAPFIFFIGRQDSDEPEEEEEFEFDRAKKEKRPRGDSRSFSEIKPGWGPELAGGRRRRWRLFEQLLFAIDQSIDVIRGEFESVTVRDRIGGARFYAVAAKNAARIIDIVDFRIALAGRDSIRIRIFSRFDVNAICRASRGT
jgi:hypothetical protein